VKKNSSGNTDYHLTKLQNRFTTTR